MDWSTLSADVIREVGSLCVGEMAKYKIDIEKEMKSFLDSSKANIETWTKQVASGELSKDDYKTLLKGKEAVVSMMILKHKGIAKIKAEQLSKDIINALITFVFKLLP